MSEKIPGQAQVVIIGGGIVGCSTAYHLVELGFKDVVLLERKRISSGTSWAAAGLLGQLWSTSPLTRLAQYGADLYAGLEAKPGQPTGYKRHGSIRVSRTAERRREYQRALGMARAFGPQDVGPGVLALQACEQSFGLFAGPVVPGMGIQNNGAGWGCIGHPRELPSARILRKCH